ncbi:DsrE family protein [Desulfitobacterium sp. Sab5]|uniref:DsrE family protein n=1 Tax=Desulfitobacterium nosdiversum TaxID=3375356 RepID=UPI003CF8EA95
MEESNGIKDNANNGGRLAVLWTSSDREVALKMVFMYTCNSKLKGWWDDVTLIVWGPSSKLLSVDIELQNELKKAQEAGVKVQACRACADMYEVTEKLEALDIEVIYMGEPLSNYLKNGWKVITL